MLMSNLYCNRLFVKNVNVSVNGSDVYKVRLFIRIDNFRFSSKYGNESGEYPNAAQNTSIDYDDHCTYALRHDDNKKNDAKNDAAKKNAAKKNDSKKNDAKSDNNNVETNANSGNNNNNRNNNNDNCNYIDTKSSCDVCKVIRRCYQAELRRR